MKNINVLYVTTESLDTDPIIRSQVVPLINKLVTDSESISSIKLLTFENSETRYCKLSKGVELVKMTNKSHFFNQLSLFMYILKNGKYFDVIHVRSYLPMLMVILFKKIKGYKVIFDPRGLYADEVLYYGGNIFLGYFFKVLEYFFYKKSDLVVTVSKKFEEYVLERFKLHGDKVCTVETFSQPNKNLSDSASVINIRSICSWAESDIILCYSGSMEKWQQLDKILDFFVMAEKHSDKFRFAFFSKSKNKIESIIADKLLPKNTVVLSLEPTELCTVMFQCDYGFLFREKHIINTVSAPIKFNDYLLSGLSVVLTSEIGDSSDFLQSKKLGFVIDDFTSESFDSVITKLTNRTENEKKLVINSVLKYRGLDKITELYIKLYNKVVSN